MATLYSGNCRPSSDRSVCLFTMMQKMGNGFIEAAIQ